MNKKSRYGQNKDILLEIIKLCLSLDKKAYQIYRSFSHSCTDEKLKLFWKQMSEDEHEHIKFWKKILTVAEKGTIPHVFGKPFTVKQDLESMLSNVDQLVQRSKSDLTTINTFQIACSLEFYLLHPVFTRLFHFMNVVLKGKSLEKDYESHLTKFINALERYSVAAPELVLMGETIKRLWEDNRQLVIENITDSLTGILNRRGFFNSVKPLAYLAQRGSYTVGFMMLDIDNFKEVNDTYGHQAGDKVLSFVSDTLLASIRTSDVVGRYGGDEFIIYFSRVALNALRTIAGKIRSKIETESKKYIPITLSIGISHGVIKKNIELETERLIQKADESLQQAKTRGKDRIVMSG